MNWLRTVPAFLITPVLLLAQAGGTTGGGTTGGSTGGTAPGTTNRPPTTTSVPSSTLPTQPTEASRPIFLSGRVRYSDGGAPADRVAIERVCNGRPHTEGYTDSKGNFSFELGRNNMMYADATESNPMGGLGRSSATGAAAATQMGNGVTERALMNCEIRANLPGFRSDVIMLASRKFMDNPELGTIVLHRMANVEGLTTSGTSALAPKDAKKAFDKGLDLAKKKKLEEAEGQMEKAVELYPKYAVAWVELGRMQDARQKPDAARASFQKAIDADPKLVQPYEALYVMAARERKWQEVADLTEKVTKMNPYDFPGAYSLNAMANLNLQKPALAEKSVREAIKLDVDNRVPRNGYMLGLILAQKQDYENSVVLLRTYLQGLEASAKFDGNFTAGKEMETVKKQIAEVEKFVSAKSGAAPQN
jgi:tetratricopeptide (TPR) repeat protein